MTNTTATSLAERLQEVASKLDAPAALAPEFDYAKAWDDLVALLREAASVLLKEGNQQDSSSQTIPVGPLDRAATREASADLIAILRDLLSYGCPVCQGDCAAANPQFSSCPMERAREAIRDHEEGVTR